MEMEKIVSNYTENIGKVKRGSGGASPPEANGMKRSRIKWKLLLFDESEFFFLFRQSNVIRSLAIKKHVFF